MNKTKLQHLLHLCLSAHASDLTPELLNELCKLGNILNHKRCAEHNMQNAISDLAGSSDLLYYAGICCGTGMASIGKSLQFDMLKIYGNFLFINNQITICILMNNTMSSSSIICWGHISRKREISGSTFHNYCTSHEI